MKDFNNDEFEEIFELKEYRFSPSYDMEDEEVDFVEFNDYETQFYIDHGYSSGFISNIGPSLADEENMYYDDNY